MNQTSTNPILISPFFCFKMKPSSFFIMFSVVAITLHLVIPFLVGKDLLKAMAVNQKDIEFKEAYGSVNNFDIPRDDYKYNSTQDIINNFQPTVNKMGYPISHSIKNRILSKSQISDHQNSSQFENHVNNMPSITPQTKIEIREVYPNSMKYEPQSILEEEIDVPKLISIFLACHQMLIICYLTVCLILFCMKNSSVGTCMIFSFSISNMINAILYLISSLFFFSVILYDEITYYQSKDLLYICSLFSSLIVIYGIYLFWSGLLIKVSKDIIPGKDIEENQTQFVQENLA